MSFCRRNFDIDKKPAWINFINNRGHKAWSEVVLKKEILRSVLKPTPKDFLKSGLRNV